MVEKEDKADIIEKAYDLGYKYEEEYGGCGQSVMAALLDTFNLEHDDVFKALTGYGGGGGLFGDSGCGGYVGGILFLSLLSGRERENFADPEKKRFKSYEVSRKLHARFIDEYGTVICRDIQTVVFGRPFFLPDEDEFQKFENAGAHTELCPDIVGKASKWAAEIVFEENIRPI
ncbi:hypothetical protein AKJ56_00830 [candidate division MSBL1 archaeon SCGC-AAA382N08]|uniref:C_GCAxxG_C_C family protein n=1 Tax=candidate division MSBL1 archaeon SCGC-AAA382N08 TaxID=1698285 RepID=A0A133VQ68_9EURY|nr:hypothetical protein AKJ56_00830 [candidate division MSBL1 archaeon SCGC-AAA382N08]